VGAESTRHLEKVSDRFDDVANEINSIVIDRYRVGPSSGRTLVYLFWRS